MVNCWAWDNARRRKKKKWLGYEYYFLCNVENIIRDASNCFVGRSSGVAGGLPSRSPVGRSFVTLLVVWLLSFLTPIASVCRKVSCDVRDHFLHSIFSILFASPSPAILLSNSPALTIIVPNDRSISNLCTEHVEHVSRAAERQWNGEIQGGAKAVRFLSLGIWCLSNMLLISSERTVRLQCLFASSQKKRLRTRETDNNKLIPELHWTWYPIKRQIPQLTRYRGCEFNNKRIDLVAEISVPLSQHLLSLWSGSGINALVINGNKSL